MKKIFIAILILTISAALIIYADNNNRRALADELLTVINFQKNIETQTDMVQKMFTMPGAEHSQSMIKKLNDIIEKEMSWNKLKNDYISVYAEVFTEQELNEFIRFHKTPVGKKIAGKTPELTRRIMEMSQKKSMELLPKIQAIMQGM